VQLGSTRGGILGGNYDSKYDYMLSVIATLSLSEDSVYSAFRHNMLNPASWEAPQALAALLGLN